MNGADIDHALQHLPLRIDPFERIALADLMCSIGEKGWMVQLHDGEGNSIPTPYLSACSPDLLSRMGESPRESLVLRDPRRQRKVGWIRIAYGDGPGDLVYDYDPFEELVRLLERWEERNDTVL